MALSIYHQTEAFKNHNTEYSPTKSASSELDEALYSIEIVGAERGT